MARLTLDFPEELFCFSTSLSVRVTDINGANHLANDALISMISEARARFLHAYAIAEVVNNHGGQLNELTGVVDDLVAAVNGNGTLFNTLKNSIVSAVLQALRDQGHIA